MNGDEYVQRGAAYAQAWDILFDGCKVPPSWDVFQTELLAIRRGTSAAITPQWAANNIVSRYQQIPC